jgi:hypothetical protein
MPNRCTNPKDTNQYRLWARRILCCYPRTWRERYEREWEYHRGRSCCAEKSFERSTLALWVGPSRSGDTRYGGRVASNDHLNRTHLVEAPQLQGSPGNLEIVIVFMGGAAVAAIYALWHGWRISREQAA